MEKEEALYHLRQGHSLIWNEYRKKNPNWRPNLEGEDLSEINFVPDGKAAFDLKNANLVGCKLPPLSHLLVGQFIQGSSKKGGFQTRVVVPESQIDDLLSAVREGNTNIMSDLLKKAEARHLSGEENIEDALANYSHKSENLDSTQIADRLKETAAGHLSGILIDQTTSIADGSDIEMLVRLGARFVTQEELKRERAEVPHKVFISYAWADEEKIQAMEQWLRRKGLSTTIDKRDFFAGEQIRDEIIRGMSNADAILLFHSERTVDKPWIEFERKLARKFKEGAAQEQKTPPQVIYVVLDDTPLPQLEKKRIAIEAKGKKFPDVCWDIYNAILKIPKTIPDIDLSKWDEVMF